MNKCCQRRKKSAMVTIQNERDWLESIAWTYSQNIQKRGKSRGMVWKPMNYFLKFLEIMGI